MRIPAINGKQNFRAFVAIIVGVSQIVPGSFFYGSDGLITGETFSLFRIQETHAAAYTLTQNYFRFYVDNDALKPNDPWSVGLIDLGENTQITLNDLPPASSEKLRLRMSIIVASTTLPTSTEAFKLQFGVASATCSGISDWNNIGGVTSSTIWRGVSETPIDGTALSTNPPTGGDLLLSVSDRAGSYENENPTILNPFVVGGGEDIEYDWTLQDNGAAPSTLYCFRMVKSDDTALDGYNFYPSLTTSGYRPKTQKWRWYDDEIHETPTTALAGEGVAPSNTANNNIVKLRITVADTANVAGVDTKFRLQFSEYSDFSSGVMNVVEQVDCVGNSLWCYGNGADADNATITTQLLSDSNAMGTHNESGTSTSTFVPGANNATEFEFTVKNAGAQTNTTYFFRLVDASTINLVPLNTGSSYPSLITEGSGITFTITGLPVGTSTAGVITTVSATATSVSLGSLDAGTPAVVGQRLTVTTNASNGYMIYTSENHGLISDGGATILGVMASNGGPAVWAIPAGVTGAYGYHTTASVLYAGSTRFAADNTYAHFENSLQEIAYSAFPVSNDVTDVIVKAEITDMHPAGSYSSSIEYIIVPVF